ncbi:MAG: MFS transporter [Turicibacter sp.]|nr:MFS transporter [Turicibacter sp.]
MKQKRKFSGNFKLVLASKIISILGGNVLGFAMILFLVQFTQSAALLGVMSALTLVPSIILTPLGGVIADRINKKWMIVLFDFLKGIGSFILLGLLLTQSYTFWNITALRIAMMAVTVLAGPVFVATLPKIVEEEALVEANGMFQAIGALGLIGGSIVGGVLFGIVGIYHITLFSGILFMLSAIVDLFIQIPHEKLEKVGNLWKTTRTDLAESVHFLKHEKPLIFKLAFLVSFISLLFPPIFNVGLPFIVTLIFEQPPTLTFGIAALGMLLGGILAGSFKKWLGIEHLSKWVFAVGATAIPLALSFLSGFVGHPLAFWLFNFSLFAVLFLFALLNALFGAFIQKEVPERILGKVDSLLTLISNLSSPLGVLAMGFFIETIHLPILFLGIAILTWVIAILCGRLLKKPGTHVFGNAEWAPTAD